MTQPTAPPPAAVALFGDRLPLVERFADWLTGPGITRGLLGPREADQVWERHLLDGLGMTSLIEPAAMVVDLGSGAGLPGLTLLLARPDLRMVLVEPKARRADFLREVCADLGLTATVVRARATPQGLVALPEGSADEPLLAADVVTARAVASTADLARWAAPLLRAGGKLLAIKGSTAGTELERDRHVLDRLGYSNVRLVTATGGDVAHSRDQEAPTTETVPASTATVIAMTWGRVSRET